MISFPFHVLAAGVSAASAPPNVQLSTIERNSLSVSTNEALQLQKGGLKKAIIESSLLSFTNQIERKEEKGKASGWIAAAAAQESAQAIRSGVKT